MMCMFFNPWIFPVKMHGSGFFSSEFEYLVVFGGQPYGVEFDCYKSTEHVAKKSADFPSSNSQLTKFASTQDGFILAV